LVKHIAKQANPENMSHIDQPTIVVGYFADQGSMERFLSFFEAEAENMPTLHLQSDC